VKAPPPTERQVQRGILALCGRVFPSAIIAHVPNGSHLSGNDAARSRQMGALKGDGLKVGFPDLIVIWNHGVGFLEVKRPRLGRVSPVQEAMHQALAERGARLAVVTSAEEAQQALEGWGVPAISDRRAA
jgi:hypothetical protein